MTTTDSKKIISQWLGLEEELSEKSCAQLIDNACLQALLDTAKLINNDDWVELERLLTESGDVEVTTFLKSKIPDLEDLVLKSSLKVLERVFPILSFSKAQYTKLA